MAKFGRNNSSRKRSMIHPAFDCNWSVWRRAACSRRWDCPSPDSSHIIHGAAACCVAGRFRAGGDHAAAAAIAKVIVPALTQGASQASESVFSGGPERILAATTAQGALQANSPSPATIQSSMPGATPSATGESFSIPMVAVPATTAVPAIAQGTCIRTRRYPPRSRRPRRRRLLLRQASHFPFRRSVQIGARNLRQGMILKQAAI